MCRESERERERERNRERERERKRQRERERERERKRERERENQSCSELIWTESSSTLVRLRRHRTSSIIIEPWNNLSWLIKKKIPFL